MSTLKTTNISHPDSPTPQIALTSNTMTIDVETFNLPEDTTVDGEVIINRKNTIDITLFANLFLMGG
jgi:hypothetical protein